VHGEPPAVNSDRDPVSAAAGQPEQGLQLRAPVLQLRDGASASDRACAPHMRPWQPGVHGRPAGLALHAQGRKGTRGVFSPPRSDPAGTHLTRTGMEIRPSGVVSLSCAVSQSRPGIPKVKWGRGTIWYNQTINLRGTTELVSKRCDIGENTYPWDGGSGQTTRFRQES
jgi:hypothetical protein